MPPKKKRPNSLSNKPEKKQSKVKESDVFDLPKKSNKTK